MPTVMITGANRGLGLEMVKQYAADGWEVIACCRHPQMASQLKEFDGKVEVYALDVSDEASVKSVKKAIKDQPIDVLVNNAGVYLDQGKGFGQLQGQDWLTTMAVNVVGPFRMAQHFVDNLGKGREKKIVMISSQMGSISDNSMGGSYLYRSSKAALNAASKSLALDLKPSGVTVLILHPGWVLTDMGGPNALLKPEQSVQGMRQVITQKSIEDSGRFWSWSGKELPW